MFEPHPIIPQTPDQARQRDQIALGIARHRENPRAELARLRNAIRTHRAQIQAAGDLHVIPEHDEHNQPVFDAKHAADHALWAHLPETPTRPAEE